MMRKILPGLRGFSAESLKKMRLFYEGWMMLENGSSISGDDNSVIAITETGEIDIYHAMVIPNTADFPATEFLAVPFTHHSRILSKTKTLLISHSVPFLPFHSFIPEIFRKFAANNKKQKIWLSIKESY
ncbi:hypothetical protein [Bacteroides sp. GM023]|uniref:hypothetical protein n=1 Tax=Bacteroides sp. GM023 TaxID=2723058 RepID=UPI001CC2AE5E|nr:hypothetical protein [Bacteroides sp. GM023]